MFVGRTSRGHAKGRSHRIFHPPLLSAVRALFFLARRIQPFLSLVYREVEFCVVVVFHIQSIDWLPTRKKLLYMVANPARGLLNRGGKAEEKMSRSSPPPPPPRCSFRENKNKITRRIHVSRRYASRRDAGGLGPSRVRTRIPTTRRLGQWVSLRKILRFRVR